MGVSAAGGPAGPADRPADPGPADAEAERDYAPEIAPASGEGRTALDGFALPDGVTGSVWAAEPLLANPVAIDVDRRGRVFVCETFRQQKGVEDNRYHMDWLRDDLAAATVADREAYIRKHVPDADALYTAEQDRVRLVTDADGDGAADTATVFAGGFDALAAGTGAGVLARPNGDVYYTCIPDLWRLRDADGDGVAEDRDPLLSGFGVRFAFRGHDMHGLTLGPDGRLYWSIGDRGFHVVNKEGGLLAMPGTGAVFRSELDGTGLEVVAYGLRNPQELAFDDAGNLFTWDNNSDSGDLARWVHVLKGADSGWRMYYQYLPDRGPWNRELTWVPQDWEPGDGTDDPTVDTDPATAAGVPRDTAAAAIRPAFALPPLANIGDGPSGLTIDPGVGLPPALAGHFFACDFRGTPADSGIRHWANEPDGATFKLTDAGKYVWGVLATDATFAPDGALFACDWVSGWDGVGKGRVYRFADDAHLAPASAALLATDFAHLETPRLTAMLTDRDRRVRLEAQLELAGRNATDALLAVAEDATADPFARRHALWGYGVCVRTRGADAGELAQFAGDADPVLRWWAVRLLGELAPAAFAPQITAALRDEDPRVVREAALAATEPAATAWLREALARFPGDAAIFHAASLGLSETAEPAELAAMLGATLASKPGLGGDEVAALNDRLHDAAVVALRRTGDWGQIARALRLAEAGTPQVWLELARAAVDVPATADAVPALRAAAAPRGVSPSGGGWTFGTDAGADGAPAVLEAVIRRSLMAGFLLGGRGEAERALNLAGSGGTGGSAELTALRLEALAELAMWGTPDRLDRVTGRLRPAAEWAAVSDANRVEGGEVVRDAAFLPDLLPRYAAGLLDGPPEVQTAAVNLLAQYGVSSALPAVSEIAADGAAPAKLRVAAVNAVDALADPAAAAEIARRAVASDSPAVRAAGRAVLVRRDPAAAVASLSRALAEGEPVERQAAVAALAGLGTPEADAALKPWLDKLVAGDAPPEVALELLEASDTRRDGGLGEYLAMYESNRGPDKLDAWTEALAGGDADAGREIFFGRSAASCRRCHMAEGSGGNVGPVLDGIAAKRDRRYLLESIVNPDAKIAEGFATAVVLTEDGRVRTGVVKDDADDALTLVMPTGEEVVIPADTILDRAVGASAMPADIPDALTKREMRDLVEYLAFLETPPATDAAGGGGHE